MSLNDNGSYRVYSFCSRQYLKAKKRLFRMRVKANGKDGSQKTMITAVDGTFRPDFVCYYLVFIGENQSRYALSVDDNKRVRLKPFDEDIKENKDLRQSALFIPEEFSSPFRAFKLVKPGLENYCIAANKKGKLSVKMFHEDMPDPETIFVISTVP